MGVLLDLLFLAFLTTFLSVKPANAVEICESNSTFRLPENFQLESASNYPYAEAGLQIFYLVKASCSGGELKQWRFIAANTFINGLHLGVFRRQRYRPHVLDLVGETYIERMRVPSAHVGQWVKFTTYNPIKVLQDDLIGFWYDNIRTPREELTILNKNCDSRQGDPVSNAYVFLKDQNTFNLEPGPTDISVNIHYADVRCRIPALVAIIETPPPILPRLSTPSIPLFKPIGYENNPQHNPWIPQFITDVFGNLPQFLPTTQATTTPWPLPKPVTMRPFYQTTWSPFGGNNNNNFNSRDSFNPFYTHFDQRCNMVPSMLKQCSRESLRSYYDYRTGACTLFFGCGPATSSSSNNFDTIQDCMMTCERDALISQVLMYPMATTEAPTTTTTTTTPSPIRLPLPVPSNNYGGSSFSNYQMPYYDLFAGRFRTPARPAFWPYLGR